MLPDEPDGQVPSPAATDPSPSARNQGFLVYLSGNNASGKTTLGRCLAERLGARHLPEERFDTTYLDDLFNQQHRWCFEAQVHFLAFKVDLVRSAAANGIAAFIDRSPYEDAEVFARYFFETGKMDRRSYRTYRSLYDLFYMGLPEPNLFIWCDCPPEELEQRVSSRGRRYEELYPEKHLHALDVLYREWVSSVIKRYPHKLYRLDSKRHDFRDPACIARIADEINRLLTQRTEPQLSLFDPVSELDSLKRLELLEPVVRPLSSQTRRRRRRPKAYIAAPFTGKATTPTPVALSSGGTQLFDTAPSLAHGTIAENEYRRFLEDVERIVRASGFDTFVPHRDVNQWGHRVLRPEQAAVECTKHVFDSDVLIGLTAKSLGAHYEVGVAVGYGITAILLIQEGDETSFLMEGLHDHARVQEIKFSNLEDLRSKLAPILTSLALGRQA